MDGPVQSLVLGLPAVASLILRFRSAEVAAVIYGRQLVIGSS